MVLDDSVLSPEGAALLRDIAMEWKDWSELSATQHMIEDYASQITGMSKTDPEWDTSDVSQITNVKFTHGAAIFTFDFVVKQKLFNFFLLLGRVPLMAEHTLTETISANNPWPKPVTVYNYDNTVSLAGSFYKDREQQPEMVVELFFAYLAAVRASSVNVSALSKQQQLRLVMFDYRRSPQACLLGEELGKRCCKRASF